MILSGSEIKARLGSDIVIDPFSDDQLNPNSYNLRLHNELLVYEEIVLDMRRPSRYRRMQIPPEGLVLQPNQMYLGRTMEYTETRNLVPMLEGRSSIGRLGMFVHVTAGFGDVGFCGYWTLEIIAVQPIRVYAGVQVCQIFYHTSKARSRSIIRASTRRTKTFSRAFSTRIFRRTTVRRNWTSAATDRPRQRRTKESPPRRVAGANRPVLMLLHVTLSELF